jgi:hypothetical protein
LKNKEENQKTINGYLKYSNMAFQLTGLILLSFWGGLKIDKYFKLPYPFITMILILAVFSGFMYKLYKELFNSAKK